MTPKQATIYLFINLRSLSLRGGENFDMEKCRQLLDMGADVNAHDPMSLGWTPLMHALQAESEEGAKFFLERGADVNARSDRSCTALILAVSRGYIDIVRTLLDKGANMDVPGANGEPAILTAIRYGRAEIAALLAERGAKVDGHFKVDGRNRGLIEAAVHLRQPDAAKALQAGLNARRAAFQAAAEKGTVRKRPILRVKRGAGL